MTVLRKFDWQSPEVRNPFFKMWLSKTPIMTSSKAWNELAVTKRWIFESVNLLCSFPRYQRDNPEVESKNTQDNNRIGNLYERLAINGKMNALLQSR